MTIKQLTDQYEEIRIYLNKKWPLKDRDHRVFARTMKIVEELGELADDILTSMNLQRKSKIAKFTRESLEDEFADVLGSLILLANELDIDVDKVIQKKIDFTRERFGMNSKKKS